MRNLAAAGGGVSYRGGGGGGGTLLSNLKTTLVSQVRMLDRVDEDASEVAW